MKKIDPLRILLIHPPAKSPAHPPGDLIRAAAGLAGRGLAVTIYDANLDFYLGQVFNPHESGFLLGRVKEKSDRGALAKAGLESPSDLTSPNDEAGLANALAILRSIDFYRPESFLTARRGLEDRLRLVCLAFYPSRLDWGRFYNHTLTDWPKMWKFCQDSASNPFIRFCRGGFRRRMDEADAGLLVFSVSSPDQVGASLTMAHFAKKEQPEIQVALWGDHLIRAGAPACMPGFWDHLLPAHDLAPLANLAARLAGLGEKTPCPAGAAPPSFLAGISWEGYLAPELVLPIHGYTGKTQQIMSAARRAGIRGFLLADTEMNLAQLTGMTGNEPGLCLGLKRALPGNMSEAELVRFYQAGVRLVCWQAPAAPDDFKASTRILAAASEAGLWNHVLVPGEAGQEYPLVKFLLANPNLGHSWERPGEAGLFSAAPRIWEVESGAYPPLPGRPLWQAAADPAHLLLYVNHHGAERLKRWRVREDGSSFYTVGENISYQFTPPEDLPAEVMAEIIRLVLAGGSGLPQYVEYNLRRAFLIGLALEEGAIVGAGSLKYPRPEYVESVKRRSGLDLSGHLERGYTTVRPPYRGLGIGTRLLEGETKRARDAGKKVFSIIGEDNIASQKMALRNNTRKVATFYSQHLGKEMGVWMPHWMLEEK